METDGRHIERTSQSLQQKFTVRNFFIRPVIRDYVKLKMLKGGELEKNVILAFMTDLRIVGETNE